MLAVSYLMISGHLLGESRYVLIVYFDHAFILDLGIPPLLLSLLLLPVVFLDLFTQLLHVLFIEPFELLHLVFQEFYATLVLVDFYLLLLENGVSQDLLLVFLG